MIKELFEQLDKMWNLSDDPRYKGENPGCLILSDRIEEEFEKMSDEEVKKILDALPADRLEQILVAMEDLVDEREFFKPYIDMALS